MHPQPGYMHGKWSMVVDRTFGDQIVLKNQACITKHGQGERSIPLSVEYGWPYLFQQGLERGFWYQKYGTVTFIGRDRSAAKDISPRWVSLTDAIQRRLGVLVSRDAEEPKTWLRISPLLLKSLINCPMRRYYSFIASIYSNLIIVQLRPIKCLRFRIILYSC